MTVRTAAGKQLAPYVRTATGLARLASKPPSGLPPESDSYFAQWSKSGPLADDNWFPLGGWYANAGDTYTVAPYDNIGEAVSDAGMNMVWGTWNFLDQDYQSTWAIAQPLMESAAANNLHVVASAYPGGNAQWTSMTSTIQSWYLSAHPEADQWIIGWLLGEEYDYFRNGYNTACSATPVHNKYLSLVSQDSTRPIGVNWSKCIGTRRVQLNHNGTGGYDTGTADGDLALYMASCDASSVDIYGWTDPYLPNNGAYWYGMGIDGSRSYCVDKTRPLWGFVDTARGVTAEQAPITADQMEQAVWSIIVHGGRGIMYFNYDFVVGSSGIWAPDYSYTTQRTQMIARLQTVNARLMGLAPVLNSPQLGTIDSVGREIATSYVSVSSTGGIPIDVMVRQHSGQTYIFAQASGDSTHPASGSTTGTFTVVGGGSASVTVRDESRTVSMTGGVFTDTFTAYQTHIYVLGQVNSIAATDPVGILDSKSLARTKTLADSVGLVDSASFSVAVTALKFDLMQEYFHDGGTKATNQTTDLGISAAKFKAVSTSGETTYWDANHGIVAYYCLPHDIINNDANLTTSYAQTTDAAYRTKMAALVAAYGIDDVYQLMCPEWDNDPGNNGWAQNRFVEAGVGGSRPDIPTGLTRQQAYDQWIHFYLANNHGGFPHHQLGQFLSVPYTTRGWKIKCNNVNAGTCHYSYEMGVDLVTLQRNNDDIGGLIGAIGFVRGAAAQYSKPFGFDVSSWRTYSSAGAGPTEYNSSQVLTTGWSNATYKRTYYLMFMSGPRVITPEGADYTTNGATTINGRTYNPWGVCVRDFCDFAFTRHPERGVPHVPVAIMKDHISFLEPRSGQWTSGREVWCFQMAPNGGENMMHNLLNMCYPNYSVWATNLTTGEPWGTGRWGEQFDVLTERASAAVMGNYRVVILSTNAVMDATLQAALTTFVNGGGIVVINAKQLSGSAHQALTGITITGTASTSGTLTWELDSTTTSEPAFNYTTVTLGTATRVARTGASTPQVVRNLVGSGEVWTVLPDYMSTPDNTATLGVAAKLVDYFINRFAVGILSGGNHNNIDYAVTKQAGASGAANTVTIINSNAPGGTTWTGTVSLPQGTPVAEWTADATPSSSNSGGRTLITASVPAGDVRVYAVG